MSRAGESHRAPTAAAPSGPSHRDGSADLRAADSAAGPLLPASRLDRALGRPREQWTAEDLVRHARDQNVRVVSLMHVGGDGWLKTLDFVPRSFGHLRDILQYGERADGSSLFPGLGITAGASDVVLRPRVSTAFLDPFSPLPTLAVLCGHAGRDGASLPQSPDTVVRRAHDRFRAETGMTLHALGEVEFFLGRAATARDIYGAADRGYHATAPFVFGEGLRRRAMALLAEIGVPVKYGHSEVGYVEASTADEVIWEQHEIELGLAPLPEAADSVALTHWVLRNLAHADDLRCSFAPVLRRGHAGTGLHFHFSPVDPQGANVPTRGEDGRLTEPSRWLIGGLVTHGAALMAFGNREEASFVRLAQAKETPESVTWGEFDRRALVRLPMVARDATGRAVSPPTIEFRLPDGSAHPHLLLAGVAQAAVSGRSRADLDAVIEAASAQRGGQATAIPRGFREIAEALQSHRAAFEAGEVFPPVMIAGLIARAERLGG